MISSSGWASCKDLDLYAVLTFGLNGETYKNGDLEVTIINGRYMCNIPIDEIPVKGWHLVAKEDVTLVTIEHKPNGKGYKFVLSDKLANSLLLTGSFVVYENCKGKGYGKVLKVERFRMTPEERQEYRKIIDIA